MLPVALLTVTLAATPSIDDASMSWNGKVMRVDVATSAALPLEKARVQLEDRVLRVTLSDAQLPVAERAFSDSMLKARRVPGGVVLEATIGRKVGCSGEPRLGLQSQGLVITADCTLRSTTAPAEVSSRAEDIRALKAALALPPEPAKEATLTEWVAPPPPPLPAVAAGATGIPSLESTRAKQPGTQPNPVPASLGTLDSERSNGGFILPLFALAGLGAAAYVLSKKKARATHLVQVLETAHLGPKRSLIVARVGGQTLLLGTSETGVALLTTIEEDPTLQAAADRAAAGVGLEAALADKESGSSQASFLSRLIAGAHGKAAKGQDAFAQMLAESAEDQDLRRKLEAGLAGRVS